MVVQRVVQMVVWMVVMLVGNLERIQAALMVEYLAEKSALMMVAPMAA